MADAATADQADDGVVQIPGRRRLPASSQPERDVKIEQPRELDERLLEALDGEHTLEGLREEFGTELVDDTISQMQELAVIEDAADDDLIDPTEYARFDRQLRYFSDIAVGGLVPSECQRRLREAKVAVLGVGGLGGWTAMALATCGIGEMWLIDGDRVEISNLNRQILYSVADLGLLKVEVAAARLRAFNPEAKITSTARRLGSAAEIADFIDGADVVIDAIDWPAFEVEVWCNEACFEAGIPYITMSHFPPIARVGPLYVPGVTGCYVCQTIRWRREYPLLDAAIDAQRAKPSPAATIGPACGLIGGQIGMEVMHLLTGLRDPVDPGRRTHLRPAHDGGRPQRRRAGARLPGLRESSPRRPAGGEGDGRRVASAV